MKSPQLSILVLNYKTKEKTLDCIRSIASFYNHELKVNMCEVLVLDNGSKDDSYQFLKRQTQALNNVHVFESEENLGFAKGQNFLSEKAKGEFIFFLNSDAKVKDDGLFKMVQFLQKHTQVGVLGAKLVLLVGSVEKSTGSFYTPFNLFLAMVGGERVGLVRKSYNHIQKVDWVSGGAMMVRKSVFNQLDGFDEGYFMYFEDMDFCYRVKKGGIEVFYFPDVAVEHETHGSANRDYAILNIYKGILRFYKKNRSYQEYLFARNLLFLKAFLLSCIGRDLYKKVSVN